MNSRTSLAALVLRLALAAVFVLHGLDKVNEASNFGTNWQPVLMQPKLSAPLQAAVAWGELVGGAALAIGFLPRIAALGIIAIMAGAIATVHGKNGFSMKDSGWEYNYVLICICVGVLLLGGGSYSVGKLFGSPFDKL